MADIPFLVLNQNRFAWTSTERLHQWPKVGPQTVYLYGPSGIGKSHLVRHFAREERTAHPDMSIASLTADQLVAESRECLAAVRQESALLGKASNKPDLSSRRQRQTRAAPVAVAAGRVEPDMRRDTWWQSGLPTDGAFDELERRYRAVDLLILEDLTDLQHLHRVQIQLVSIVDEILRRGGRVLWTSSRSPGELEGFIPRLLTRCVAGVCAALKPLDEASRFKLLCHFACAKQIPVPEDASRLLAAEFCVSPCELLAALVSLDVAARQTRGAISCELVRRFLDEAVKPRRLALDEVTAAVARHFGVTVGGLRSASRQQALVVPRHCAMHLGRELTGLPLRAIAEFFGGRQHSTVLHACQRLEELLADRPDLRHELALVRRKLGSAERSADVL
jgi:chromosomal replication initiation ATPase DnaA